MGHRVAQQQRLRFRKLTVLEYEHEFATVGIEALNRVWDPAWEKPKIVFLHIGDKTLAVRVNRRNPRCPVKHEGPFTGRVPMQLPDASGCQSHVYACQGLGDGQFPNSHLTRPSAFISALVRKRERILEVLDQALGVRAGWPDGIRVLAIKRLIGRAGISSAPVCAASLCSHDFLQRGKAAYRYRGFSDETSTSECAHNYFS